MVKYYRTQKKEIDEVFQLYLDEYGIPAGTFNLTLNRTGIQDSSVSMKETVHTLVDQMSDDDLRMCIENEKENER